MKHRVKNTLARFRKSDSGHASIEFAIMFPIFFVIMLSGIELGMLTLRYAYLERALDIAVREVRLSTGDAPTHEELIEIICNEATAIHECSTNLKLEMIPADPRAWVPIGETATCTNREEEVQPVTQFVAGQSNELMILRACAKFQRLYPTIGFGGALTADSAGDVALVAMSAFVQEPL